MMIIIIIIIITIIMTMTFTVTVTVTVIVIVIVIMIMIMIMIVTMIMMCLHAACRPRFLAMFLFFVLYSLFPEAGYYSDGQNFLDTSIPKGFCDIRATKY